jgi:hypothetical protein
MENKSRVIKNVFVGWLPSTGHGEDHIENTPPIVVCSFDVFTESLPSNGCPVVES